MVEKQLLVRKIENGIVIDHIPAGKALSVLGLLEINTNEIMFIASNVESSKYGKKDVIKIEGKYLTSEEIDLISLVAPAATINLIHNWELKDKHTVKLPKSIEGIFKCRNPACVTNDELIKTKTNFNVVPSHVMEKSVFKCSNCGSMLYYNEVTKFLKTNPTLVSGLVSKSAIENVFLHLIIKKNTLRIAPNLNELFVFKSGRKSPNFINMGALTDGESLAQIKWVFASYVAMLLKEGKLEDFDFIFGPAYKGISLAVLTCEGLNELFGMKKRYLYDRKEEKDYGDKRMDQIIVGAGYFKPGSKILMIDDVITTGGTKVEGFEKLNVLGDHKVVGLVIALDRQEKMGDAFKVEDKSAVQNIENQFGIKVFSILNMESIFKSLKTSLSEDIKKCWIDYYKKYGAVEIS